MQRGPPHEGTVPADLGVSKPLGWTRTTVREPLSQRLAYGAALALVVTLAAAMVSVGNGATRPLNSHEILVAQTATEMLERGDYLVPYYNGIIRLEKPPLPYWLAVLVHRTVGDPETAWVSELEVRIACLVAGSLLLLVTFLLGSVAFDDRRVGLVAAAMLATSYDFFTYSRSARPEMLYALFCVLQMLGLMIAVRRAERGLSTTGGAVLAWSATVAALYAKGPQLPGFFLIGTALALALRRPRLSPVKVLRLPMGVAFVVVGVLPYFAYLATQSEGALGFWAGQMVQNKPVPLWLRPLRLYYPAAIVVGMVPWIVGAGLALRYAWKRRHPSIVVLASCILVMVVCLSFAGKLRHHYVLPATPLFAVLAAAAVVDLYRRLRAGEIPLRTLRNLAVAQAVLTGIALAIAAGMAVSPHAVTGKRMLLAAAPWLGIGVAFAGMGLRLAEPRPALAFASFVAAFFAGWAAVAVAGIDSSPRWASAARFAVRVAEVTRPNATIHLESGIEESLVYYARRRVVWSKVQDWLAANPRGRVPLFVCEGACAGGEGRVIIEQRDVPREEAMILLRPRRPRAVPTPGSAPASADPEASRP